MKVDLMGRAITNALGRSMNVDQFVEKYKVPEDEQGELRQFWAQVQIEASAVPPGQTIMVPND